MNDKVLRAGIIGCGKMAHLHAQGLKECKNADLVAASGRNKERTDGFAAKYQIDAYTDTGKMIIDSALDFVIICTPHPNHLEPVLEALDNGAHVLIEKPMASSLADCDKMIQKAAEKGLEIGIISQRRYYEQVKRVKRAIDQGKIGTPMLATVQMLGWRDEAYYRSDPWRGSWEYEGGGVMVNQAPHQLDLLHWFMGPVKEVFGYWGNINHPYIEVEDTAVAVVKFMNGGMATLLMSNSQKPGIYGKVHVHGSNGASVGVQTESGAMFIAGMVPLSQPPLVDLWTVPGEEHMITEWEKEDREYFSAVDAASHYVGLQIQDFALSIIEGRKPLVDGEQGRRTVELFTAIYRSQRDGQPVSFPLPADDGKGDYDGRLR